MRYLNITKAIEAWKGIQPLSERDRERLSRKFTVDFNFNSNHIEGNTLTYGQTELLLLFGKVTGEAQMKDLEEMKASNVGLKMMQEQAGLKDIPLTQNFIRQLHKTLIREDYTVHTKLPGGQQGSYVIHAGQYKTRPNSVITRYGDRFEYASPEETPALMTDLVNWHNEEEQRGKLSPVELAALFHYRYIRIHPFEDGNGRTARLLSDYILDLNGYGFNQIGSLEEYFAYDIDEYYRSLQMGLPALFYEGRENPPHPEVWILYFLRMMELHAKRAVELAAESDVQRLEPSLSHLGKKERAFLDYLLKHKVERFAPIDFAKLFKVTNRTIINWCVALSKNGFLKPDTSGRRVRSYSVAPMPL